ncbi:hypothetical protein GCM10028815_07570 [Mariniluteicoccus flavus]
MLVDGPPPWVPLPGRDCRRVESDPTRRSFSAPDRPTGPDEADITRPAAPQCLRTGLVSLCFSQAFKGSWVSEPLT